ncbi:hypothetical protein [Spirochaeta isovalerica]|uniref:Polysaccharide deacetylase n=1 Tax=Spirochaeta isovalerica TaxID=150 RepID=A0A841RGH5_9SPIO|nr:hypothetical protein [Spirochaeta isovalerica]MBB6482491.1 hypothetical protein [Spirochaeta isovalerica]
MGEMENPEDALAQYLDWDNPVIRNEGKISYLAPRTGDGYIPVLAFHRIGDDPHLELTLERFESLLIFFNDNRFHVMTDLQLIEGDFTFAVNGSFPVVLGCDDSSSGVFYYQTVKALKNSSFVMENGDYVISDDCMVYVLEKYLPLEQGRRNFTFYLTFDAIPFRQTGGGFNPGPPYLAMPAVQSKLVYLNRNFYLGNHTLHHYVTEVVSELEYLFELIGYYDVLNSYGIQTEGKSTLAYSYGIGDITPERQLTVKNFNYGGNTIAGAFDYNNEFTKPVDSGEVNRYDISRIGVDNGNFEEVLKRLKETELYRNRRAVLVKSPEYPFDLSDYDINENDQNYILIGD